MPEDGFIHIGELAEHTGLSLRTIRHYDEIGLLKPSGRSEGGFRLYSQSDLSRLMLIRRMKPLGYTLEQMGDLLALIEARETERATPETEAALQGFREDARERRAKLAKQLEAADEFIAQLTAR